MKKVLQRRAAFLLGMRGDFSKLCEAGMPNPEPPWTDS